MRDRLTEYQFGDMDLYLSRMSAAMQEKLFFLQYLNNVNGVIGVVDYGCADGTLLIHLFNWAKENNREIYLVGYDKSTEMLKRAEESFKNAKVGEYCKYLFTAKSHVAEAVARLNSDVTVLVLSSVLHEVYSYADSHMDIEDFWDGIMGGVLFDYVAFRDMTYCVEEIASAETVDIVRNNLKYQKQLHDFESIYGSISEGNNYLHFLLKYRYVENWERELHENYLPLTYRDYLNHFEVGQRYKALHNEFYTLPFLKEEVKKDFGVDLNEKTHVKLFLECIK